MTTTAVVNTPLNTEAMNRSFTLVFAGWWGVDRALLTHSCSMHAFHMMFVHKMCDKLGVVCTEKDISPMVRLRPDAKKQGRHHALYNTLQWSRYGLSDVYFGENEVRFNLKEDCVLRLFTRPKLSTLITVQEVSLMLLECAQL